MKDVEIRVSKEGDTRPGPGGPAIHVVAIDVIENKIVGSQSAVPLYVTNASGERILTARSEDPFVDPAYREGNILERMYAVLQQECHKAGVVAIWGFTYATEHFAGLGFEVAFRCDFGFIVFDVVKGYRYLDGLKQDRSFLAKAEIAVLVLASRLKYSVHVGFKATEGYSISKETRKGWEDLVPSQPGAFYLLHDYNFPGWVNYLHYSLVNESGKSVGLIVFSNKAEVAYLVHMIFARNLSEETKRHFLNAVISDMSKRPTVLRAWGFTHNEAGRDDIELLRGCGFVFTNQGISFVWKKLDQESPLSVNNFVLSKLASPDL